MKSRTWMFGPAALVLALGMTGGVSAKDNGTAAPVRLAQAEKKAREAKPKGLTAKQIEAIEKLTGKALTEDQKNQLNEANREKTAAIKAANDKFQEQKAKILGLTPAELKAKEKEAAAKARAEKKAKGAGG